MRLRRPDPSIVPIERARSIVGGVARARVREPKNADGGGFHASGALEVFASRTRASVPVLAVPDAAAPAGRGSFLRGLLLHRGPALVDHRARLDRARGRREKKVSTRSPIARRARGNGDDDADAFAREPGRVDAPASTGVRLPSAGTFTNAHRTRWHVRTAVRLGGADTPFSHTAFLSLRVFCRDEQWTFSAGKRQIYAGEQSEVFARTNVFSRAMAQSARPKINAFENRSSRPGRLQRPLL